jgi:hypothetical protein
MSKSHDGNASDNNVFRERSAAILKEFAASEGPRYLVADSKPVFNTRLNPIRKSLLVECFWTMLMQ